MRDPGDPRPVERDARSLHPAILPRGPVAIFMLIPKTAGTSLCTILSRRYPPARLHTPATPAPHFAGELSSLPPDRLAGLDCVAVHLFFGVHELLSRPSVYAALLRDPVERAVSRYYCVRRRPDRDLHGLASRLSLDELAREPLVAIDNVQTRFVSGVNGPQTPPSPHVV
jgi:hypothetical protein